MYQILNPFPNDDWLDSVFAYLFAGILLVGWLAVLLAELGLFSLPLLLVLLLPGIAWLAWVSYRWLHGVQRAVGRHSHPTTWLLLALLALVALLYFRPHETILGGSDAGVYVSLGANVAKNASLLIKDAGLADLPPSLYPSLFREQPEYFTQARYLLLPGFYLSDDQAGSIIPQFYPLDPVWRAVFYAVGGLRSSLYATPLWGVLGCLAFFLALRRLFGPWVALLATLFLSLNATQVWFVRYSTSEALTQFLLWGGFYFLIRHVQRAPTTPDAERHMLWDGLLAGVGLGQVMLTRVDFYFLWLIPWGCLIFWRVTRQWSRLYWAFLLPFGLLSLHSLLHGWLQSRPYLVDTYRLNLLALPIPWFVLAGAGCLFLLAFVVLDVRLDSWRRWLPVWRWGVVVLILLVVLLACYAYFLWPDTAQLDQRVVYYFYGDYGIPDVQSCNLVRLGWYLSPLGLALALGGIVWLLWDLRAPAPASRAPLAVILFLGLGMFFALLYIQNNRNNPFHIYVMRRYVPVVIPFFLAAGAYFLARLAALHRRLLGVGLALALLELFLLLSVTRTFAFSIDNQGAMQQMDSLAEEIGEPALLLFDDDQPVGTAGLLGTPLRFLYGHTVYDLQEQQLDGEALLAQVERWQAEGQRVLLAVGPWGVREPFADWPLTPVSQVWFDLPSLETSYYQRPKRVIHNRFALSLYEFAAAPTSQAAAQDLTIDIGGADFFYAASGWYGPEKLSVDLTARWTMTNAVVSLPDLALLQQDELSVSVLMSGKGVASGEPLSVTLLADGETVVDWQVTPGFALYQAILPTDGDLDTLELVCEAWSPAAEGLNDDTRWLGVLVDWLSLTIPEP